MLLVPRSFSGDWKFLHIKHQRGSSLVRFHDPTNREKVMGSTVVTPVFSSAALPEG